MDIEDLIIYTKKLEKRIERMEWAFDRRTKLVNELMEANQDLQIQLRKYQDKAMDELTKQAQELGMGY